jgi:hypothetical protein
MVGERQRPIVMERRRPTVGERRRLGRRRARLRTLLRLSVPVALTAVVVVVVVTALSQIGRSSGPYRRTVDRGYATLAGPLVAESNASGASLVSFLHQASALGRIAFFFDLDVLAADTAATRRRFDAITPPDPVTAAGCAAAIADRAEAVSSLRSSLESEVGGRTGLAPVDPGVTAAAMGSAGALLRSGDASWARCRRALRHAPGSPLLPVSVWVRDPRVYGAGAVATLVSQVAGSSQLVPVHDISIVAVVTEPSAVASAQTLAVPATTSLVAHVVLRNRGNVDEHGVELGGVITLQGTPMGAVPLQRTVDLSAGRSTTMLLPTFAVEPGSSYTVQVVAQSPGANGNGPPASRSLVIQVQPAATLTTVTSTPLAGVRGRPVTFVARLTSTLPSAGSPTGTVAFTDDGVTIPGCGATAVHAGKATCSTTYSTASTHAITAAFSGDARFAGSISPAITLKVGG